MKLILVIASLLCSYVASCHEAYRGDRISILHDSLERYVSKLDAKVGVCVIIDGKDTVSINGTSQFPMLSVYKFPQALAVADFCDRNGIEFMDSISIAASEIKTGTYSPLRDKYGSCDMRLSIGELLAYSIQLSDNNACDILFRFIGGTQVADAYIKGLGIAGISILSTEDEMHTDAGLCYENSATPIAMAQLLDKFDTELRHSSGNMSAVANLMETCSTGADRLAASIPDGAILGHKTGTGDRNVEGRIIAVNDAGYVHSPDGSRYVIAVFVSDSAYDMMQSSSIIACMANYFR